MEQKTGLSLMVYALICRKCAANVSTRPWAAAQSRFPNGCIPTESC